MYMSQMSFITFGSSNIHGWWGIMYEGSSDHNLGMSLVVVDHSLRIFREKDIFNTTEPQR